MPLCLVPVLLPHWDAVEVIGQMIGPEIDLQITVVVPIARLVMNGLPQGTNHFLWGVARGGLSLQASTERLPCDAESRAVMDGVRHELELEPTAGLTLHLLQGFVIAVGRGRVAAAQRKMFLALELTAGIDFVAVWSGVAGKYPKVWRKANQVKSVLRKSQQTNTYIKNNEVQQDERKRKLGDRGKRPNLNGAGRPNKQSKAKRSR